MALRFFSLGITLAKGRRGRPAAEPDRRLQSDPGLRGTHGASGELPPHSGRCPGRANYDRRVRHRRLGDTLAGLEPNVGRFRSKASGVCAIYEAFENVTKHRSLETDAAGSPKKSSDEAPCHRDQAGRTGISSGSTNGRPISL